jgi:hypothetical protein
VAATHPRPRGMVRVREMRGTAATAPDMHRTHGHLRDAGRRMESPQSEDSRGREVVNPVCLSYH